MLCGWQCGSPALATNRLMKAASVTAGLVCVAGSAEREAQHNLCGLLRQGGISAGPGRHEERQTSHS